MSKVRDVLLAGAGMLMAAGAVTQIVRPAVAAETAVRVPAPAIDVPASPKLETAVFAGGCFWGVQGVYSHVKGVTNAVSGYAGGARNTAEYDTVSTGTTGHAESVRVTFDPRVVSYGKLLQIYFSVVADPTTLNYQGPDHGSQFIRTSSSTICPRSKRSSGYSRPSIATDRCWSQRARALRRSRSKPESVRPPTEI